MDTIQVALVDDHRLFRSGIASLINNFNGYKVLFEAANGEELIYRILPEFKPDIIFTVRPFGADPGTVVKSAALCNI
jgi:DNA-binding NarL/FixJ family response regulator